MYIWLPYNIKSVHEAERLNKSEKRNVICESELWLINRVHFYEETLW